MRRLPTRRDHTPTAAAAPPAPAATGAELLADPRTAAAVHAAWSGDPAAVVPAPPGAGKTRLVVLTAAALAERAGLRVGVAAQTRDQAVALARRLAAVTDRATLLWKRGEPHPGGVHAVTRGRMPRDGGAVMVATTARWLWSDPDQLDCDILVADEAWQMTFADLGALGAFAPQVVLVGDPGQIDPVVTGTTARWGHSHTAPDRPAPDALAAAHPDTVTTVRLGTTHRLGPETTALIQPAFYPNLPFTSARPATHLTIDGTNAPEIAHTPVGPAAAGPADPALTAACAHRARALLEGKLTDPHGTLRLDTGDVAVVCPHVNQAAAVRAQLSDLPGLLVGTANQLQGLERPATVVLHPLAGYRDLTAFAADAGRLCVMLSRHRAHATVVTDRATADLLATADTDAPGLALHRQLLDHLHTTPTLP